jgi:DNA-binding MarR family transcriptional regulator
MIDETRILTAFWHRGRRDFVEWTAAEIADRCQYDHGVTEKRISIMAQRGLVDGKTLPMGGLKGWRLTRDGQDIASAVLRGH